MFVSSSYLKILYIYTPLLLIDSKRCCSSYGSGVFMSIKCARSIRCTTAYRSYDFRARKSSRIRSMLLLEGNY